MLERISWSTYWMIIAIAAAIYYLIVFVLLYKKGFFFKRRIKSISTLTNKQNASRTFQTKLFGLEETTTEKSQGETIFQPPVDDNIFMPMVHDLIQELKEFISDISQRSYVKEEVIMGIQIIVRNYKKLENSPYLKSINDFIKNECEQDCSIHLSEEDIRRIWLG